MSSEPSLLADQDRGPPDPMEHVLLRAESPTGLEASASANAQGAPGVQLLPRTSSEASIEEKLKAASATAPAPADPALGMPDSPASAAASEALSEAPLADPAAQQQAQWQPPPQPLASPSLLAPPLAVVDSQESPAPAPAPAPPDGASPLLLVRSVTEDSAAPPSDSSAPEARPRARRKKLVQDACVGTEAAVTAPVPPTPSGADTRKTQADVEWLVEASKNVSRELVARVAVAEEQARLYMMMNGTRMLKYHYHKSDRSERWVRLSRDRKKITWGGRLETVKVSSAPISSVVGVLYGYSSKTFKRLAGLSPFLEVAALRELLDDAPPQLCFSVITTKRTLDFSIPLDQVTSDNPADPASDPVIAWILGIQSLALGNKDYVLPWTRGALLARRGWMKLNTLALRKGVRLARVVGNAAVKLRDLARRETSRANRSVFKARAGREDGTMSVASGGASPSESKTVVRVSTDPAIMLGSALGSVHSLFLQAGLLRTRSFVPVRGEVLMASSLNRELVAIALDAPTTTVDYAEFARRLSQGASRPLVLRPTRSRGSILPSIGPRRSVSPQLSDAGSRRSTRTPAATIEDDEAGEAAEAKHEASAAALRSAAPPPPPPPPPLFSPASLLPAPHSRAAPPRRDSMALGEVSEEAHASPVRSVSLASLRRREERAP